MFHTVSVKFFCDRKPHPPALLQRIQCPLTLINCSADIAYPIEFAQELHDRIQGAGLNVTLLTVKDAPHFGTVTHSSEYVNFVLTLCSSGD
jgi:pimeloyl-ACP methyl ester carboxylesterase